MEFDFFTRFLCFCAGASLKVLKECPIEINKFMGIGATVLFTGILAAISGGYALYSVFHTTQNALLLALSFGIFWGLLIFNLDRYIVSSLRKSGNKWKELFTAFPRILVALIISMVIAKPLEVRIFKDRVDRQIHENKLRKLIDDKKQINEIYERDKLNEALITKNNELVKLEKEINVLPEGAAFQKLYKEMQTLKKDYEALSNVNTKRIKQLQRQIAQVYSSQPNRLFDAKGKLIEESISLEANRKIQSYNKEAYLLRKDIAVQKEKYEKIASKVETILEQHRDQVDSRLSQAKKELNSINQEKAMADSLAFSQFKLGNQVNQKSYQATFITQLEALGTLTGEHFSTMWWASLFISFLFVLIETSPIVVKLLAPKGLYEVILERLEYEIMLKNKKSINLIESKLNQQYLLEQAKLENEAKEAFTAKDTITTTTEAKSDATILMEKPKEKIQIQNVNSTPKVVNHKKQIPRINTKKTLLEGITWKRTDSKDALCYVFRTKQENEAGEFLLIADGDISYGKWDYINKQKIWIQYEEKKSIYEISSLNKLILQMKKDTEATTMTFTRM